MRTSQNKFYYVVADEPRTVVSYRHGTSESAVSEAMRLAKQENKPFFVMHTVARIVPKVVIDSVQDVRPTIESQKRAIAEDIENRSIPF